MMKKKSKKRKKKNNKGFTFVEVLAVVAIMGILSGIAIVGVSRYREKQVQNNYDSIATSSYNAYENYIMKNGNTDVVSIIDLKEGDFVSNIQDPRNKASDCTGNVFRTNDDTKIYVNLCCGDYKQQYSFYGQELLEGEEFDSGTHTEIKDCDVTEVYEEAPIPQEDDSYIIKYSCSGASNVPNTENKKIGESATISSTKPTKSGYSFLSWKDNDGNEYKPGYKYEEEKNLELKCVMIKNGEKTYSVKYSCSGASNVPSGQTKTDGKNLTLSKTKPTKSGYTFEGWQGSDGKKYSPGATLTANEAITFTCIMTKNVIKPPSSAPTVKLYKWNGNTNPNGNTKGLSSYSSGTWFSGKILSLPSSVSGATYYEYTTTGTANEPNKKATYKNIVSEGSTTIKWRACNDGGCSAWSSSSSIKLDRTAPKCTASKSNTSSVSGVTVTFKCSDSGSGMKSTPSNVSGLKSSKTYSASDNAGNKTNVNVTITAQNQRRTRNCAAYKRCASAGCAAYNTCAHANCGAKTCTSRSCCGTTSYTTNTGYAVGCPSRPTRAGCTYIRQTTSRNVCVAYFKCYKDATCTKACCGYKTCTTSGCGCKTYNRGAACGCETWGSYNSWSNVSTCSTSSTTECRTIYY